VLEGIGGFGLGAMLRKVEGLVMLDAVFGRFKKESYRWLLDSCEHVHTRLGKELTREILV
jgi:hypothetical protein